MTFTSPVTVTEGQTVTIDLEGFGPVVVTACTEPVSVHHFTTDARTWEIRSDGIVEDVATGLQRQFFRVVRDIRTPIHETYPWDGLDSKYLDGMLVSKPADKFSPEEMLKMLDEMRRKHLPVEIPDGERKKMDDIEKVDLSRRGGVYNFHSASETGTLEFPDYRITFYIKQGTMSCNCKDFILGDSLCCKHIADVITNGEDARMVPWVMGYRAKLILPMWWNYAPSVLGEVYLIPTKTGRSWVAVLHTWQIHNGVTPHSPVDYCWVCDNSDFMQTQPFDREALPVNAMVLGTMSRGEGRSGLIFTLGEQCKFAWDRSLYICKRKSHRDLPGAKSAEATVRATGGEKEKLRYMWFLLNTGMCPFCWMAKNAAAEGKFDPLDIK